MMKTAVPLILKLSDWPTQDRTAWEALIAPSDSLFDEAGLYQAWSEGSRRIRCQGYGQWLSFIVRNHADLVAAPPASRITQGLVEAFIDEGKQRLRLRSVSNLILSLATLARGFEQSQDWAWLWRAGMRLYQQSDPSALKPRIPIAASDLFHWGTARMRQISGVLNEGHPSPVQATQYRQALTVSLLIARPLRARTFCNLEIGRHLVPLPQGFLLRFEASDMKDRRSRSFAVPSELVGPLHYYLARCRPVLLDGRHSDAVWISQKGNDLSQDSFTSGLALLTERHFGITLRPHAFRSIAATSIAEVSPENVGIIRDILGHATLRTSEKHYNRARTVMASDTWQDDVAAFVRSYRHHGKRADL